MQKFKAFSAVLALLLCLSGVAFGQETTGSIEGTVTDAQGGRVAGATVNVEGPAFNRTTTTDDQGFYRILQVPPGKYKVKTSASSFSDTTHTDVQVLLGRATPTDVVLQVTGVAANVEVSSGDVAPIDTTSNKIQTNITSEVIDLLPKGTRMDSVLQISGAVRKEPQSRGFQVDGSSGAENTFIIDGSEVTNFRTGQLRDTNNIPFEFVQEVQVKTSGFDAEFGGATGGVVNVVTKSGANEFHGSFGMQFEVDRLSARQTLTGRVNDTDPQYLGSPNILLPSATTLGYINPPGDSFSNLFPTASISGPILKNRLWFFVAAAPQFYRTERDFQFANGEARTYNRNLRNDYEFARLDANITDTLRVNGTFTYSPQRENGQIPAYTNPAPQPGDASQLGGRVAANNFTVNGTWTPTSRLVVNVRGGRNYLNEMDSAYGKVSAGTRIRCIGGGTPAGATDPCGAGFNSGPDPTKKVKDISIRKNFDADMSYLVDNLAGRHNFKFGYQLNRLSNDVDQGYVGVGEVRLMWGQSDQGIGVNTCPSGPCSSYGVGYLQDFGTSGKASSTNTAFYAQDSWQPFQRLTLNLGIRFEKENVPSFSDTGTPIEFNWGDKIAPRLGFAYDVLGNGKMKVFASYGQFYDRFKYELPRGSFGGDVFLRYFFPLADPNWTTYTREYALSHTLVGPVNFRVPSNDPSDFRVDPDLKSPRQTEFTAGTEYSLTSDIVLSGRFTHKNLDRTIEDAGIPDADGNEIFYIVNPGMGIHSKAFAPGLPTPPKAQRRYDAMEIRLDKRYSRNYYLNASYTYSRLYGNYSGLASSDEVDALGVGRSAPNVNRFFDLPFMGFTTDGKPDNGRLATDRPHALKLFGAYTFDWSKVTGNSSNHSTELSASFIGMSGTPVSTIVDIYGGTAFLYGRGDLGRTPMFTQTDATLKHTVKFGDGSKSLRFELNVLNLFNENNVLAIFPQISPSSFSSETFGLGEEKRLETMQAIFNGGLTSQIVAGLADGSIAKDARYNKPLTFQIPRQLRFGFRFMF